MNEDVEVIVSRLSEAQRKALIWPGSYHDPNTIRSVRRRGLWGRGGLTDAGELVRSHLLKGQP